MSLEQLRNFLLYCTLFNFATLWLWALILLLPHAWWYRAMRRLFQLTDEPFDALNLAGLLVYKIGVVLFNLVPYLALRLVG